MSTHTSLPATYYAAKIFSSLKKIPDSKAQTCEWLVSSAPPATSARDAYEKLFIGAALSCGTEKLKKVAKVRM